MLMKAEIEQRETGYSRRRRLTKSNLRAANFSAATIALHRSVFVE